jgi:murein L,D-transpeptidase YafK
MNKPAKPKIVIYKSHRRLELLDGERTVREFGVVLGSSAAGDKETEGDGRTPEGTFYLFTKNRASKFHLSLGVSYPDKRAAERGLRDGLITSDESEAICGAIDAGKIPPQKTRLGGEIYIHGGGVDGDWTEGCVAMADSEIEELFELVDAGCPVIIFP